MPVVINPATGGTLEVMADDTPDSIGEKLEAARAAQRDWAELPLERRLNAIRAFAALVRERRESLATTLTSEVGKPIRESRAELAALDERLAFFLAHTPDSIAERVVLATGPAAAGATEERIRYEPLGVVVNISAWNYPWFVGSNVFVPALLTGNAVLYKPSEHATLTGLAIAGLLREAGVPPAVFAPVLGAGDIGAELLRQQADGVFFTGSYATGRVVARAAAERMIPVQLELGGKDPAYVCDDVDPVAAAAAVAVGVFYNAGQSCCAVERIYVHQGVWEPFVDALVDAARSLRIGDPMDERTELGPLTREAQLAVLEEQVQEALNGGASLRCGGQRRPGPGFYFEPTVVTEVDHGMRIMREESFGPVIGVQKVAGDEEAVRLMDDTEYGLTAAVYTPDRVRAEAVLARLDVGSAYWNCCDRVSPRLPWSGRRHSGVGVTLSEAGIRAFARPKAWHLVLPSDGESSLEGLRQH